MNKLRQRIVGGCGVVGVVDNCDDEWFDDEDGEFVWGPTPMICVDFELRVNGL